MKNKKVYMKTDITSFCKSFAFCLDIILKYNMSAMDNKQ